MPHDEPAVTVKGKVEDVFGHRIVVQATKKKLLADIGKHNMERIEISIGDEVEMTGHQKTSELKIQKLMVNGKSVKLEAKKEDHHKEEDGHPADPSVALQAAKHENVTVIGKPHRKPKHFEVLGKNAEGRLVELHVELNGKLRKSKSVELDDEKWADELSAA